MTHLRRRWAWTQERLAADDRSVKPAWSELILMSYRRRMEELTKPESLELMSSVQVGRLAFVHNALPAIRPVNHLVDNDAVIIRATLGAAITKDIAAE
jgi:hypothetical protein